MILIKAIKYLSSKVNCSDLKPHVDAISNRIIDTAKMMRNGFYNPLMMGSYSLKNIVKVLPNGLKYSQEGNLVGDGGDAMIIWFEYTKPNSTYEQKALIKKDLIKYCAQDTLNLYLFLNIYRLTMYLLIQIENTINSEIINDIKFNIIILTFLSIYSELIYLSSKCE